jgi:hypothetical protein
VQIRLRVVPIVERDFLLSHRLVGWRVDRRDFDLFEGGGEDAASTCTFATVVEIVDPVQPDVIVTIFSLDRFIAAFVKGGGGGLIRRQMASFMFLEGGWVLVFLLRSLAAKLVFLPSASMALPKDVMRAVARLKWGFRSAIDLAGRLL